MPHPVAAAQAAPAQPQAALRRDGAGGVRAAAGPRRHGPSRAVGVGGPSHGATDSGWGTMRADPPCTTLHPSVPP